MRRVTVSRSGCSVSCYRRDDASWNTKWQAHFFMPSAKTALGHNKADRDIFGGQSAKEIDTYARVAVFRMSSLQRFVRAYRVSISSDLLGEEEHLQEFDANLTTKVVPDAERSRCLELLRQRTLAELAHDVHPPTSPPPPPPPSRKTFFWKKIQRWRGLRCRPAQTSAARHNNTRREVLGDSP